MGTLDEENTFDIEQIAKIRSFIEERHPIQRGLVAALTKIEEQLTGLTGVEMIKKAQAIMDERREIDPDMYDAYMAFVKAEKESRGHKFSDEKKLKEIEDFKKQSTRLSDKVYYKDNGNGEYTLLADNVIYEVKNLIIPPLLPSHILFDAHDGAYVMEIKTGAAVARKDDY